MAIWRKQDKHQVYLSFYNDSGKLVTEYIPPELDPLRFWLHNKYYDMLFKYNRTFYYWHVRHLLNIQDRKCEDLRFLHHALSDHNKANQMNWRESFAFEHLYKRYGIEYENMAKHIFDSQNNKKAIDHTYTNAYKKRWQLERTAEWKILYHGVDKITCTEILKLFLKDSNREIARSKDRVRKKEKRMRSSE